MPVTNTPSSRTAGKKSEPAGVGAPPQSDLGHEVESVSSAEPALDRRGRLWSSAAIGPSVFTDDQLLIYDFDGSDSVRPLNRGATELHDAVRGEPGPHFDTEVLSALRNAARRCEVEGQAWMELAVGIPRRSLPAHLTPAIEISHFLLTVIERAPSSRDRVSSETVAAIAHHIRNPMAGIRGAVEVIGAELEHDKAELLEIARQITSRIDDLDRSLDSMLAYLHAPPPQLRRIELRALVERIVAEEARPAPLRALEIRLTAGDVVLTADSKQLTRTLLDLLTNCAEALPGGKGLVEVSLRKDPRFASLTLMDTGSGIPDNVMPRVCDPFFTTKPRALGLGLTNARQVARAHGGELTVRTAGGRTEVRLQLPLQPESVA